MSSEGFVKTVGGSLDMSDSIDPPPAGRGQPPPLLPRGDAGWQAFLFFTTGLSPIPPQGLQRFYVSAGMAKLPG
jgi:hypothetical protein